MENSRPRGRGRDNRPAWLVQQERGESRDRVGVRNQENDSRPASKRPRVQVETVVKAETVEEDDTPDPHEEELLLQALDGDDFVSQEEKEAEAARQRRLKRKQRLQQADNSATTEKETAASSTTNYARQSTIRITAKEDKTHEPEHEVVVSTRNEDNDDFDMFSSSVSPPPRDPGKTGMTEKNVTSQSQTQHHQQDWDDAEGYYKATIGEVVELDSQNRFRVQGIVGKGVFSTVLKCETLNNSNTTIPQVTALKLIRHNDTMAKAALEEIKFLHKLQDSEGIVRMYLPQTKILEHRGHTCLVFDYAPYNLRHVLRKFGRGVGLSLTGVRAYFVQLLAALQHLERFKLIHADIKPDNILVSEDFGKVQLCDFGSAFEVGADSTPTPYLVSRFYRAPEIVLGLIPTTAVDLWSVAVSIGELFLGRVLFTGNSNNDMLLRFMECLGAFPNRTLRQHLLVCQKYPVPKHFEKKGGTFVFLHQTSDKVTGKAVSVSHTLPANPKKPLQQVLLQAKSAGDSRVQLLQLSNLMTKCLSLDPTRRLALSEALQHPFFETTTVQKEEEEE